MTVPGRVHVGGAGVVAHAALDAARRLQYRRLVVEALDDLLEGLDAPFGRHLPHGLPVVVQQIGVIGLGPALGERQAVDALLVR